MDREAEGDARRLAAVKWLLITKRGLRKRRSGNRKALDQPSRPSAADVDQENGTTRGAGAGWPNRDCARYRQREPLGKSG